MKLSEVGEFELIDILAEMVHRSQDVKTPAWRNLILGIGDDAAAWKNEPGTTLATTDCLVQDAHFRLGQTAWNDLGWKALAVNLSDIAAMGGAPRYALVTLGLPGDTEVEDVTDLYKGMLELGNMYGVAVVGGDISSSDKVFISLTVTGVAGECLLTRSASRPSDLIAVTGYIGAAATGLRLITGGVAPTREDAALRQAFLRPRPRLAEGEIILKEGACAAIDISDGLVADLGHICRASNVGARIRVESLPLHPSASKIFRAEALDMALGGGEDYELLFTASRSIIDRVRAKTSLTVSVIGEMTGEHPGRVKVEACGRPYKLNRPGWDHFGAD